MQNRDKISCVAPGRPPSPISRGLISPGGSRWTNRSRRWLGKSRCGEWSRPPEPSPDASGIVVQLPRAATECEFDLVSEPGQVMQRARTSDAKSSNSPPAQGALHDPITLSSNSMVGQRMAVSLGVELSNRFVDGAVEVIRTVERLMSEVMPLQVAPETLDVVQLRSIFRQPLDGEPGGARGERGAACLAGVDRAVVEDQNEGLDRDA